MEVMRLVLNPKLQQNHRAGSGDFDLIVVAMSSPNREPMSVLSKIPLSERTKPVPILIISDNPSYTEADKQSIHHLDFPFAIDAFCDKVQEILHTEPLTDINRHLTSESTTTLLSNNLSLGVVKTGRKSTIDVKEYTQQTEYWVG
jgi:hypothetical protein